MKITVPVVKKLPVAEEAGEGEISSVKDYAASLKRGEGVYIFLLCTSVVRCFIDGSVLLLNLDRL